MMCLIKIPYLEFTILGYCIWWFWFRKVEEGIGIKFYILALHLGAIVESKACVSILVMKRKGRRYILRGKSFRLSKKTTMRYRECSDLYLLSLLIMENDEQYPPKWASSSSFYKLKEEDDPCKCCFFMVVHTTTVFISFLGSRPHNPLPGGRWLVVIKIPLKPLRGIHAMSLSLFVPHSCMTFFLCQQI